MSDKKWVLVTGATSGIGLATALLFALKGYEVIATGRSEEKMEKVKRAAEEANVTLRRVIADVADEQSVANLKSEVLALTDGYGVDILVNNAGYAEAGAIEEIPLERLRRQFDTNVIGLVAVTQAFLPQMRARRSGKIVNISSVLGKVSIPLMGAYTASKHAVEAISDAMRVELSPFGIGVITVAPGSITTNFGNTVNAAVSEWMSESSPYYRAYVKFMKDRRLDRGAKPIVIARTIVDAVQSHAPKSRYAVPMDSKAMPVAKALLPTRALDSIMTKVIMGKR
ncbi:SDR family NAD(P)-dependent oxidoreductase [Alicyclobacillus tolerans]|uniref:SDR family NAD(P)-dependent oxidoreductase n=1 Tax=Alicyclobacillus tolerans TaxID=90970 RepID=UPI001F3D46B8|nr:SDR family NAD(P)-dependent oxidoreductase [Alicyclobacillus tolerans]MCF8564029.1 SDR family NAD(P)-dependent oxidoreductase [Alicyclobacillus tolerans]